MSAPVSAARWLPPALLGPPQPASEPRPLDALLAAVDGQLRELEDDIDRVYDDLFIDSCADWAVPYIGALLGLPPDATRVEVASAVALRRRRGTPAALESFVAAVTGWRARIIEGWQVTTWAQRPDHPGPPRPAAADLRRIRRDRVGTVFERTARAVTPAGRWSPLAITALTWPWELRSYRQTQAVPLGNARYALHPLGLDAPLYVRPAPRPLGGAGPPSASELDAPVRATYAVIEALAAPGQLTYGVAWPITSAHPLAGAGERPPLLSLWDASGPLAVTSLAFGPVPAPSAPGAGAAVVDPLRGRVELGTDANDLRATFHRPVSGRIGALAADSRPDMGARVVIVVDPDATGTDPDDALEDAFKLAASSSGALTPAGDGSTDVEIRLETSLRLKAPPAQKYARSGQRWRVVAPTFMTPAIAGALDLDLGGVSLELSGFYLDGDLRIGADAADVTLDALTIRPAKNVLAVAPGAWHARLSASRCILPPIQAALAAAPIRLADCIVDGAGLELTGCGPAPAPPARRAAVDRPAAAATGLAPGLEATGVTFAGPVHTETVAADDCVFVDGVDAVHVQAGHLRHCHLGPPGSSPAVPATYRCLTAPAPAFESTAFEAGAYYALALDPDQPLLHAASDGGEVGAYHHARRATALGRLRDRIHEFVPLGLRARVELAPWEES